MVTPNPNPNPNSKYSVTPYKSSRRSTTEHNDFYQSKQWKNLRAKHVKKQPLCQECLKRYVVTAVDVVDHIIELEDNYDLRLDPKNLQSLCHACHNKKSAEQRRIRQDGTSKIMTGSEMMKWIEQKDAKRGLL